MLRHALWAYDAALRTHPLRTKALSASCISAAGDVTVQRLLATHEPQTAAPSSSTAPPPPPPPIDTLRVARQAFWSLSLAPLMHMEYSILARVRALGPLPAAAVGVAISQACFSPAIHIAYFAWSSSASSGFRRSLAEVRSDVEASLWPALRASLAVWPAATWFNLTYVALPYRVLFVNGVGFGYGALMSWMANDRRGSALHDCNEDTASRRGTAHASACDAMTSRRSSSMRGVALNS